jgi:hypothetical protein
MKAVTRKARREQRQARRLKHRIVAQQGRSVQIPARRMELERAPRVSRRVRQRLLFGAAAATPATLALIDPTVTGVFRWVMGVVALAAVVLWIMWERRGENPSPRDTGRDLGKAPAVAVPVRWTLLSGLLLIELALPHPGPVALVSFILANIMTRTERVRSFKIAGAVTIASFAAICLAGTAFLISARQAGTNASVSSGEQTVMIMCVSTAVLLPGLARWLVRHWQVQRSTTT